MKKFFIAMFVCAVSIPSFASSYRCSVELESDFAVEVNLKTEKASFFDNDNWSTIGLVEDRAVKGMGGEIIFAGMDNNDEPLRIVFDGSEMHSKSTVTYNMSGKPVTSPIECRHVSADDLYSGI